MDVAVEVVVLPKGAQARYHALGRLVRSPQHARREEQPLDVVALVEAYGELGQLPGGEGGPRARGAAPVDAIGAVVAAGVGHEHLEERDAAPIRREAVAATGRPGVSHAPFARAPLDPRGGARGVELGRLRKNRKLVHDVHGASRPYRCSVPIIGECPRCVQAFWWVCPWQA